MTMLHEDVDLGNEVGRWPMGILAAAMDLPTGWEDGVTFRTAGCTEPEIAAPCVATDTTEARPGLEVFEPIMVRQTAACSTLSQVGTVNMAMARLQGTTEWALGQTLSTGVGSANTALSDATVIHAINAPTEDLLLQTVDAISCLEQSIADVGFGGDGYIHAPPRAAAYIKSADLIDEGGYSPSGFRYVFSPGYQPDPIDASTDTIWFSATGPLWAGASPAQTMMDSATGRPAGTSWQINLDSSYAARLAMAVFDSCINLRATFVAPACIGGS